VVYTHPERIMQQSEVLFENCLLKED